MLFLLLLGCTVQTEPEKPAAPSLSAAEPAADASEPVAEVPDLAVEATLCPTDTPTPEPTPTPTPEPTPTPITDEILLSGVFDAFFNDAVFIGDSITATYQSYCTGERRTNPEFLGTASFLAAASYSLGTALKDTPSINYLIFRGMPVSISEGINQTGAKWAFILLGVNDYAGRYIEESIEKYANLIDMLREKCPGVTLVVQSLTPVTKTFAYERSIDIVQWNSFNGPLAALCEEKGVIFLDIASVLQDEEGYLPKALSSDNRFHFSREGNDLWTRELRKFAMEQMGTGGAEYIPVWPTPTPVPTDTPAPEQTTEP